MLWFHAEIPEMMLYSIFSCLGSQKKITSQVSIYTFLCVLSDSIHRRQYLAETLKDSTNLHIRRQGVILHPQHLMGAQGSSILEAERSFESTHCCGTSNFFDQTLRGRWQKMCASHLQSFCRLVPQDAILGKCLAFFWPLASEAIRRRGTTLTLLPKVSSCWGQLPSRSFSWR